MTTDKSKRTPCEIWTREERREIQWYEWRYWVSNTWKVKSRFQELKFEYNHNGYPRIKLYGNGGKNDKHTYLVHRLVYNTFNNLPMDYNYENLICHKDNNPKNSRLDNLYLGTYSDNMKQCRDDGRLKVPAFKWERNPNSKLKNSDIQNILNMIKDWICQNKIAEMYWVGCGTINDIYKWRTWKNFI